MDFCHIPFAEAKNWEHILKKDFIRELQLRLVDFTVRKGEPSGYPLRCQILMTPCLLSRSKEFLWPIMKWRVRHCLHSDLHSVMNVQLYVPLLPIACEMSLQKIINRQ